MPQRQQTQERTGKAHSSEQGKRKPRTLAQQVKIWRLHLLGVVIIYYLLISICIGTGFSLFPVLGGSLALLGLFVLLMVLQLRANVMQARMVAWVLSLDEPRSVGWLVGMCEIKAKPYRAAIKAALIRLLPRLHLEDADQFTPGQREALYLFMQWNERWEEDIADLQKATLCALEQIGDETDIPFVERMAQEAPHPDVRQAAQERLAFLHQRREEANRGQTLLRAVASPASLADELLRPTLGNEARADHLLRPGDKKDVTD